ncbi:MAG: hypothetical protein RJA30_375 [Actinomycetota bacterium]
MTLSKTHSIGLYGLQGTVIEIEADVSAQLPTFILVGLPDASLSEATSRVRAACGNSGFSFPSKKVVVNLSPAAVPKSGSGFDLAIAVAVLAAMEKIPPTGLAGKCFVGELGLDGSVRAVPGVLPVVLAARDSGFEQVVVPIGNESEAALVAGIRVSGVSHLRQLVSWLNGTDVPQPSLHVREPQSRDNASRLLDLNQVIDQEDAVEGLIVAAAGGHHISLVGAPGAGKTMLAERLPTILPELTVEQAVELAAIESLSGNGQSAITLNLQPRFQSPHHSTSRAALIGGGTGSPRPGAVSLAHHGVLFLDEALEFQTNVLEALREPLESGTVAINRIGGTARYPARFQLILAANPCPCGFAGVMGKNCTCTPLNVRRYANRLSGPILDRIDIRLAVQNASISALAGLGGPTVSSAEASRTVVAARQAAAERLAHHGVVMNAHLAGPLLRKHFKPSQKAVADLDRLTAAGKLSMRGYDRCLRLAWTLADIDGKSSPDRTHIQRAVALRGAETLVAA